MIAPLVANTGLLAACLAERRRLLGVRDVRAVQEARLREVLAANAGCEYGRRHGFDRIGNHQEYREQVPTCAWDDLADDVDRVTRGETGVLCSEPVRLLEPSSGSTAATKLVPSTRGSQREFQRGIAAWLADLYLTHPRLLGGRSYWSVTPVGASRSQLPPARVPVGFEDDADYAGPLRAAFLRRTFVVDQAVARLASLDDFHRATALGLLAAGDLRFVSVWNPTFWLLLLDQVRRLAPELAAELPSARRAACEAAAEGDWRRVWPRLALVSCWADAHAAGPAARLAATLPQAGLQPKGLLATEGVVSVPIQAAGGAVLAATSHVVEFCAEGRAVLADEVEPGQRYEVLLTTSGGLYRYRLGDEVEVTGRHGALPVLRFTGRSDAVSDLVGEKLSDAFVARCVAGLHMDGFAVLAPEGDHYTLYADHPLPGCAERLDVSLREGFHYDHARRLGQLGPVRIVRVAPGAGARLLEHRARAGQRLGDVKSSALSRTSLSWLAEGDTTAG